MDYQTQLRMEKSLKNIFGKESCLDYKKNAVLKRLTKPEYKELRQNYDLNQKRLDAERDPIEFGVVAKFFNPQGSGSWYLSELSPDHIGYGVCHIHESEIGSVDFEELARSRGRFRLPIEKDRYFENKGMKLSELMKISEGKR